MARTYGRLVCTIWENPDFVDLAPDEKITFVMLLTQPKLSLVGLLDLKLSRWTGYRVGDVLATLHGLEDAGFIAVDWETQELLVRSFTRNDPIPPTNVKLRKGLWGAWGAIESEHLRRVAVDNMPERLFDHADDIPTPLMMCRSQRMERVIQEAIEDPMVRVNGQVSDSPPPLTTTSPFDRRPAATGVRTHDFEDYGTPVHGNPEDAWTGTNR